MKMQERMMNRRYQKQPYEGDARNLGPHSTMCKAMADRERTG